MMLLQKNACISFRIQAMIVTTSYLLLIQCFFDKQTTSMLNTGFCYCSRRHLVVVVAVAVIFTSNSKEVLTKACCTVQHYVHCIFAVCFVFLP